MLQLTVLPPSPGATTRMVSGYCRPGRFAADARAHVAAARRHAPASRRADGILPLLLALLVLGGLLLTHCMSARPAPEAHSCRAETAAPVNVRGWHEVDALAD